tara:strand:+ start:1032 stop:1790 length:759 start_codon:yes stop_codon:yes gene_type:complete
MALFGDFGKLFLGGATTEDVGGAIGGLFGAEQGGRIVGKGLAGATKQAGQALGINEADVATAPAAAGVDSAATVLNVSQTGQLSPGGMGGRLAQTQQAGFGLVGPLSQLLQGGARSLLKPGVGGALTGFGLGMGADIITDMFGNQKKLVITRKLQRDVKKVFMMSGGDVGFVSANSMMLFGKSLSQDQILMILFKTFKNQGPFVTKAAVRKTRQTIRKMETLCDLKDRLAPPRRAATRRRMPAKTTTITNVR